jgi:hypothetical protein
MAALSVMISGVDGIVFCVCFCFFTPRAKKRGSAPHRRCRFNSPFEPRRRSQKRSPRAIDPRPNSRPHPTQRIARHAHTAMEYFDSDDSSDDGVSS